MNTESNYPIFKDEQALDIFARLSGYKSVSEIFELYGLIETSLTAEVLWNNSHTYHRLFSKIKVRLYNNYFDHNTTSYQTIIKLEKDGVVLIEVGMKDLYKLLNRLAYELQEE